MISFLQKAWGSRPPVLLCMIAKDFITCPNSGQIDLLLFMYSHAKEVRQLIQKTASQLCCSCLATSKIYSLNSDRHPSTEAIDLLADRRYLVRRVSEVLELLVDRDL